MGFYEQATMVAGKLNTGGGRDFEKSNPHRFAPGNPGDRATGLASISFRRSMMTAWSMAFTGARKLRRLSPDRGIADAVAGISVARGRRRGRGVTQRISAILRVLRPLCDQHGHSLGPRAVASRVGRFQARYRGDRGLEHAASPPEKTIDRWQLARQAVPSPGRRCPRTLSAARKARG